MPTDLSKLTGGSLLLAWQLRGKRVLIIGGGDVASGRIESVLIADAFITLISPKPGLHPLTSHFIESLPERITYHDRIFAGAADLGGVDMVLTAIDDVSVSREICVLCREHKIPVNVADIPPSCDFYFGSQVRDGPLQIMISTNGQSPKLANIIKRRVEEALPHNAGEAIDKVGALRAQLKERAPGVGGQLGKKRMRWMIDVCNEWEIDDLASLDDEMIKKLLDDGWEKHQRVPSLEEVGGKRLVRKAKGSSIIPQIAPALGFLAGATAAVGVAFIFMLRRP